MRETAAAVEHENGTGNANANANASVNANANANANVNATGPPEIYRPPSLAHRKNKRVPGNPSL